VWVHIIIYEEQCTWKTAITSYLATCAWLPQRSTGWSKKNHWILLSCHQLLTYCNKLSLSQSSLKVTSHHNRVSTLPCKILMAASEWWYSAQGSIAKLLMKIWNFVAYFLCTTLFLSRYWHSVRHLASIDQVLYKVPLCKQETVFLLLVASQASFCITGTPSPNPIRSSPLDIDNICSLMTQNQNKLKFILNYCLKNKREDDLNCSAVYCVPQWCVDVHKHTRTHNGSVGLGLVFLRFKMFFFWWGSGCFVLWLVLCVLFVYFILFFVLRFIFSTSAVEHSPKDVHFMSLHIVGHKHCRPQTK